MKPLEKIQRKLYDIGSGNNFLYMMPKAQATDEKKKELDYLKIEVKVKKVKVKKLVKKYKYHTIPLIGRIQSNQIHRDRK